MLYSMKLSISRVSFIESLPQSSVKYDTHLILPGFFSSSILNTSFIFFKSFRPTRLKNTKIGAQNDWDSCLIFCDRSSIITETFYPKTGELLRLLLFKEVCENLCLKSFESTSKIAPCFPCTNFYEQVKSSLYLSSPTVSHISTSTGYSSLYRN